MSIQGSHRIKKTVYLLGFAGAALFTVLLIRQGTSAVALAVARAGWWIAAIAAFHLVPLFMDTMAWSALLPKTNRLPWYQLFWMRWIGESISNLVPSAAIGGDVVRTRLATVRGVPLPIAAASVIADITLGIFAQAGFTFLGLALLVHVTGRTSLIRPTLVGVGIGLLAVIMFLLAQRRGIFSFLTEMISRLTNSSEWQSLVQDGESLDAEVRAIYGRHGALAANIGWTVISLLSSTGEIWIALHALGSSATFVNALILQSMAMTIRSAAFPVPGAVGVQEGGYLVIGNLLGIPGGTAFAISLLARVRDFAVGVPALLVWQVFEGRRFWRRRAPEASGYRSS